MATIIDLDPPGARAADLTVTEGESGSRSVYFVVSLSKPPTATVTVAYATLDRSARAPGDYRAVSGVLSFAAGQTVKTVTVGVEGDTVAESAEKFHLVLSMPTGMVIVDGVGVANIADSD